MALLALFFCTCIVMCPVLWTLCFLFSFSVAYLITSIIVPPPVRLMSRRIPELPSLRYGSLAAKSTVSGPLRVTNYYRSETLPRTNSKKGKSTYRDEVTSCKSSRPTRRVRFNLPSSDGDTSRSDAERATTATANLTTKRTAGDAGYPKTRITHISTRLDTKHGNNNNTTTSTSNHHDRGGAGYVLVTENSLRYNRVSLHRREIHTTGGGNASFQTQHHHHHYRHQLRLQEEQDLADTAGVFVSVTASPAVRTRIHPTGKYIRGTLSPTANTAAHAAPSPGGQLILRAARDGEDGLLRDLLRRAQLVGISDSDLNATDNSGRTALSYIASNGSIETLDQILQLPNLDPNIPDNEGNTPLHFAAQAGQVECLNCMLTRCRGIEIDARNNLGFTPLMKAALQGRNKCAKLLLFGEEQKIEKISLWRQWKNYFNGKRKEDAAKSCSVVIC